MMNRNLCIFSFALGLLMVVWIASSYNASNPLALTITLIIGSVYCLGSLEITRFNQATRSLSDALASIPPSLSKLEDWLKHIHPSLQNAVRLRVEGERAMLPGPALTPYLVGLLVMLGMLGTFLGMVVTLNGAVIALESTTDLSTIRASLASPIKGLGLAFGTSVAGVATSAMLGLISSLCRRERHQASQLLDLHIATDLRNFSFAHQRQETFTALQQQARAMPKVVEQLQSLLGLMERQSGQFSEGLLAQQKSFFVETRDAYQSLAKSVDQSLKTSLRDSAKLTGDTLQPLAMDILAGLARNAESLQQGLATSVHKQLDGLAGRFEHTVATVESTWTAAVDQQSRSSAQLTEGLGQSLAAFADTFEQRSATLLTHLQKELAEREEQRHSALAQTLEALATALQKEWRQAGEQTLAQQQQICATLDQTARDMSRQAERQTRETVEEITRLMEAAAEAPRAAAEVIGQLRQELSQSMARDNNLLEERSRIMATLNQLLETINHAASQQRTVIDGLVASTADLLDRVGTRFNTQVEAESTRLTDLATQVGSSAVEVACLGETLNFAVTQMGAANEKLIANLQGIETALGKTLARSDDQLAYYVAQARELIDLSIMSQKQIVEDIRQLAPQPSLTREVV